jgi:uncharacterized protein (UPF0332 family)
MFNWLLYLDVADKLVSYNSEACYLSAISRAYYRAFGKVRSQLELSGFSFNQTNIHQQVIAWLKNKADLDIKTIGWDLDKLRQERNRADYNAKESFDKLRAEKYLILAHLNVQNTENANLK